MLDYSKILLDSYFDKHTIVDSLIKSYEQFVEKDMQNIVDEEKEVSPALLPPNVESLKIVFKKIRMEKPVVFEADGSKRKLNPIEARLRKLTYAAPIKVDIDTIINGVSHESENVVVGMFPVMLRSKYCHLSGMSKDELNTAFEDPTDPGGYFIINGTERAIVSIEDLAPNRFMMTKNSVTDSYKGTVFSESKQYRIPHSFEKKNDGVYLISFSMFRKVPIIVLIKALGLLKDQEIVNLVDPKGEFDDVIVNIYTHADIQDEEQAMDYLAKQILPTQPKSVRLERLKQMLDTYLLPHIGSGEENRLWKAHNICKYWKKYLQIEYGVTDIDDRDHYMNKRLRAVGDSLNDLFRLSFRSIVRDMLYNYQRLTKRGKAPQVSTLIRHTLFTSRVNTIMGTGTWVGNRTGVSQRIERLDYLQLLSHLQRVSSPLSSSQENFQARDVHPTHVGRLCVVETPEGPNIGLRKNLSLLSEISTDLDESSQIDVLKKFGLKTEFKKSPKKVMEQN